MTSEYYALISDETGSRVLATPGDAGEMLPQLNIQESFWWQDVGPVNRAAREQLDITATTLCCFRLIGDEGMAGSRFYYAMELGEDMANGQWAEAEALTLPEQRAIAAEWLTQLPKVGVSRYRPGWRDNALRWVGDQLAGHGPTLTAAPEQVRSWERSSLWRLHTTRGTFYFKAVPEMFGSEPVLSQKLAEWQPAHCPPVLAIDETRCWMVVGDAGQHSLLRDPDTARWEAALRRYAGLQIALTKHIDDLLSLDLPDRRLETLPDRINALLADTVALKNSAVGLSEEEIATLRAAAPEFEAACRELAASGIPASLEHGDFAPGQIMFDDEGEYKFIDWSDNSISFPFFSLLFFWSELKGELADASKARLRLRDAYLEPWTKFAPMPELVRIYELAQRIAPLHHALIYHHWILPGMAARWEMERMLSYYLRISLKETT